VVFQYVAKLLIACAAGKTVPPFRHRDFGSLATIGRKRAVVRMGRFKIKGFIAWLPWSVAHIYFLIGFRNRLIVATNWLCNYMTFQRGTRLITGISGPRMEEDMPMPQEATMVPTHGSTRRRWAGRAYSAEERDRGGTGSNGLADQRFLWSNWPSDRCRKCSKA
jgi:hypothetical protein